MHRDKNEKRGFIWLSLDIAECGNCPYSFLFSIDRWSYCSYTVAERFRFIIYLNVWRCTTISNLMINEQIRDKEVRLIGPDGAQLGIVSSREAFAKAQEAGLDLVKIAPQAKPPVCKIIDYGKYRYELSRKEKEAKEKTEDN